MGTCLVNATIALLAAPAGAQETAPAAVTGGGFTLRCRNTINEGEQPLFVVDGRQIGGPLGTTSELSELSPDDLTSVEVFRVEEAARRYGTAGQRKTAPSRSRRGAIW